MVQLYKKIILIIPLVLITTVNSFSQEIENSDNNLKSLALTEIQKQLLKEQLALIKEIREGVKNNLTRDQKLIIANKRLTRIERTQLLKKSLSKKQAAFLNQKNNLLKSKRAKFRKTISKKQMIRLKQFINKKNRHDRKRLVRRLRRLIRQNID